MTITAIKCDYKLYYKDSSGENPVTVPLNQTHKSKQTKKMSFLVRLQYYKKINNYV